MALIKNNQRVIAQESGMQTAGVSRVAIPTKKQATSHHIYSAANDSRPKRQPAPVPVILKLAPESTNAEKLFSPGHFHQGTAHRSHCWGFDGKLGHHCFHDLRALVNHTAPVHYVN